MSTRLLLADDSDCMLSAMRHLLEEEPQIQILGEACTFAETLKMVADLRPEVLLLDLHLAECGDFTPEFVRSQLVSIEHILAVSFSNDNDAKALAESYGATALLDKMNLYAEMISAIVHCSKNAVPRHGAPLGSMEAKWRIQTRQRA